MKKLSFCYFLIVFIGLLGCKARAHNDLSSVTPSFLYEITPDNEASYINAYQLSVLSYMAYRQPEEIRDFGSQHGLTIDEVRELPGSFYFVASTPEVIFVVFRGTEPALRDYATDVKIVLQPFSSGRAHEGFIEAYDLVKNQIRHTVLKLINKEQKHIIMSGHSLGGALANLAALDLSELALGIRPLVDKDKGPMFKVKELYTFGAPRVFDLEASEELDKTVAAHYRFIHGNDPIAKVPGRVHQYRHAGIGYRFDRQSCEFFEAEVEEGIKQELRKPLRDQLRLGVKKLGKALTPAPLRDHSLKNYIECIGRNVQVTMNEENE
jgi:hypothetical protein